MDEDQLSDLKQSINATVSQATSNLVTKDDLAATESRVSARIEDVDLKVSAIADSLNERLTKLEY